MLALLVTGREQTGNYRLDLRCKQSKPSTVTHELAVRSKNLKAIGTHEMLLTVLVRE